MIAGLVSGALVRDPESRIAASGQNFTTGSIRSGSGDDAVFVSVIAFSDAGERLLQLRKGDLCSASGRLELARWTGRDGTERTGLKIVATEIAAARPKPRQRRDRGQPAAAPAGNGRPALDDEIPF